MMAKRVLLQAIALLILTGCVAFGASKYDDLFGPEQSNDDAVPQGGAHYRQTIKPILETRCVVCHGCYDAPCQLKLSSPEGIDRGLSKQRVYDGTRLLGKHQRDCCLMVKPPPNGGNATLPQC